MCNCIDVVTRRIQNKYEDSNAKLDLAHWGNKTAISIRYFYHRKKRNGTFNRKLEWRCIHPDYCPFCGEKLTNNDID